MLITDQQYQRLMKEYNGAAGNRHLSKQRCLPPPSTPPSLNKLPAP